MTLFGLDLEGQVIRPPAEADSLLLQVTLGCSHNRCAFCPAYKGKRFGFKEAARVEQAIEHARAHLPELRRVFLCDGDALILPQPRLEAVLGRIAERLPWVTRVNAYANAKALARKSDAELIRLRELGLSTVYLGLESGLDGVLSAMGKWGGVEEHLRQAERARHAGLKLSVTVLLGLAGRGGEGSTALAHARATGEALSRMDPEQASALALMVAPGTPLHDRQTRGDFTPQDDRGLLLELRELLEHLHLSRGLFFSNHASNPLRLRLRLPRDKAAGLAAVEQALAGESRLVPAAYRRL
jgi:radical SAM superfamily enzyme YgiQ (UPF0313 family)